MMLSSVFPFSFLLITSKTIAYNNRVFGRNAFRIDSYRLFSKNNKYRDFQEFSPSSSSQFKGFGGSYITNSSVSAVVGGNKKKCDKNNHGLNARGEVGVGVGGEGIAKTMNQSIYFQYLTDMKTPLVVGVGSAGTGKTFLACYSAIELLRNKSIDRIILTRPIINVDDEQLGYLPGDIQSKMSPYTRPIFDIFLEYYSRKELEDLIYKGIIEISPLAFMRGRTFRNAFIIADEMQNSSPSQLLMLLTRMGLGTKMVVIGDVSQSDRVDGGEDGLSALVRRIRNSPPDSDIRLIELGVGDIQRSPIVSKILELFRERPSSVGYKKDNNKDVDVKDIIVVKENTKDGMIINEIENKGLDRKKGDEKNKTDGFDNDCALIPLKDFYSNGKRGNI